MESCSHVLYIHVTLHLAASVQHRSSSTRRGRSLRWAWPGLPAPRVAPLGLSVRQGVGGGACTMLCHGERSPRVLSPAPPSSIQIILHPIPLQQQPPAFRADIVLGWRITRHRRRKCLLIGHARRSACLCGWPSSHQCGDMFAWTPKFWMKNK